MRSEDGVITANVPLAKTNQLDESMQTPLILSGEEHITILMLRTFTITMDIQESIIAS